MVAVVRTLCHAGTTEQSAAQVPVFRQSDAGHGLSPESDFGRFNRQNGAFASMTEAFDAEVFYLRPSAVRDRSEEPQR